MWIELLPTSMAAMRIMATAFSHLDALSFPRHGEDRLRLCPQCRPFADGRRAIRDDIRERVVELARKRSWSAQAS
jgi:hypothetical protein